MTHPSELNWLMRDQLIEFLRCAADTQRYQMGINGINLTILEYECSPTIVELAWSALEYACTRRRIRVQREWSRHSLRYKYALLEAAACVEEESWP